jgi:hypothetical protein
MHCSAVLWVRARQPTGGEGMYISVGAAILILILLIIFVF